MKARHGSVLIGSIAALVIALGHTGATAHAEPADDSYLGLLRGAGVPVADRGQMIDLGHSVCKQLAEPAGDAAAVTARVVDTVRTNGGVSPTLARFIVRVAVKVYCPQMVDKVATGKLPELPRGPHRGAAK